MKLEFYYNTGTEHGGPLVASACIPADGNSSFPWQEGKLEFYEVDLEKLPGDREQWRRRNEYFRQTLRDELKEHIVVRNRDTLKPWTRLAFENIHKYSLSRYRSFVHAKLFEDDGTEFDSADSIPLYPPDYRAPSPLPFQQIGRDPAELEAEQTIIREMREIHQKRQLARQQDDSERAREAETMLVQYKLAHKEQDDSKLEEIRSWLRQAKEANPSGGRKTVRYPLDEEQVQAAKPEEPMEPKISSEAELDEEKPSTAEQLFKKAKNARKQSSE